MRLQFVEIIPGSDVVELTGRNEQGKSSILDVILMVFGGAKYIPDMPVYRGADKGEAELLTEEYLIKWTVKPDGKTTLKVMSPDGKATYNAPQLLLQKIAGLVGFDPEQLATAKPEVQRQLLGSILGIDEALATFDVDRKVAYENRTSVGKQRDALANQLSNGIPEPTERVDVRAVFAEIDGVNNHNKLVDDRLREIETRRANAAKHRAAAENYNAQALALFERAELANAEADEQERLIAAIDVPEKRDATEYQATVASAHETNARADSRDRLLAVQADHTAKAAEYDELTAAIDEIDAAKLALVQQSPMPVPGLGLEPNYITYDGLPFKQLSSAKRLEIAVAICMALNPVLKVILIRSGSMMDDDHKAIVYNMARAHGYQVWCEIVDTSGEFGIVIEDGKVLRVNEITSEVAARISSAEDVDTISGESEQ